MTKPINLTPFAEQQEALRKAKVTGRWQGVMFICLTLIIIQLITM